MTEGSLLGERLLRGWRSDARHRHCLNRRSSTIDYMILNESMLIYPGSSIAPADKILEAVAAVLELEVSLIGKALSAWP
jgi:hypothetical protein